MVAWTVRIIFVALAALIGWIIQTNLFGDQTGVTGLRRFYHLLLPAMALLLVAGELTFHKRYLRHIVAVFFGLLLGVVISALIGLFLIFVFPPNPDDRLVDTVAFQALPPITLMVCYVTIIIVIQTRDHFRFIIPYVDLSNQGRPTGGMVLDTSALIDGRVAGLAESRVLDASLILPKFVLLELQQVADSEDRSRRIRGRRGLEILARLQQCPSVEVRIIDRDFPSVQGVDRKLILCAREMDAKIMTCDYNLAQVAAIENVAAVNLNDIAAACRPAALPGEEIIVSVIKAGEGAGQGVGYLDDGTMVVVEGGRKFIGKEITAQVTNLRQTSTGRMVFSRRVGGDEGGEPRGGEPRGRAGEDKTGPEPAP
jgi:uncharacterized protein YacL